MTTVQGFVQGFVGVWRIRGLNFQEGVSYALYKYKCLKKKKLRHFYSVMSYFHFSMGSATVSFTEKAKGHGMMSCTQSSTLLLVLIRV